MGKLALVLSVFALGSLSVAACGDDDEEANAPATTTAEESTKTTAEPSDPLVGEWDSGPVPISKVRAAVVAADADADLDQLLRFIGVAGAKSLEFNRVFYREGDLPFIMDTVWDPTAGPKPTDASHGPYELLPKHRVAVTSADADIHKYREVYSYGVDGDRLTMRVVRLTDPSVTAKELRLGKQFLAAETAVPLKRVGN
jgi:hypothetical protein